jgi:hypothetical protein
MKLISIAILVLLSFALIGSSDPPSATSWTQPAVTIAGASSAAVSAYQLVQPPDTNLHAWLITGTIGIASSSGCTAGAASVTFNWSDPRGANSYKPINVGYASAIATPASGSSLGSQVMIGPLTLFTSTTDPITVSTTVPACTSFTYGYAITVSQLY